jgi:predicted metalloprotease with PDZ domain
MKKVKLLFIILITVASFNFAQQKFFVNLNDRTDDLFKVSIVPTGLTDENKIFQFASTAPGTYQLMDIGRYVRSFKAFDETGNEISTKQLSTNQWEISEPTKTKKINYTIAETWDTPVDKNIVYAMSGTSLEKDHAVINGQAVFGYFHGKQKDPVYIKLDYPSDWLIGTALQKDSDGFYEAKDYDEVVDSPIMLGTLTKSSQKIENTTIDIYSYSKSGKVSADALMTMLEDIINATSQFTSGLPVNHYTFLFHFENMTMGAWEHNYSSFYVFGEAELTDQFAQQIKSIAAHEFYHVVVPLNIHSELVNNFNYEKPTMSQHLWLYEGTTEWAAGILQLRDYLMTLDEYLKEFNKKLQMNDFYDQSISLVDLSLNSTEKQDQYPNIYQKGAVVAALLDIRLLELSNGTKGYREVINQLYKDYGVNKPFSEKDFFAEFVNRTYPEIGDFITRYIKGTEKLPVKEYFAKLGIEYKENVGVDSSKIALGFGLGVKDGKLAITSVTVPQEGGVKANDYVVKANGEDINLQNAQAKFSYLNKLKVGETVALTVERDGELKEVKITMQPRQIKHQFKVLDNVSENQLTLRSAWLKNL